MKRVIRRLNERMVVSVNRRSVHDSMRTRAAGQQHKHNHQQIAQQVFHWQDCSSLAVFKSLNLKRLVFKWAWRYLFRCTVVCNWPT